MAITGDDTRQALLEKMQEVVEKMQTEYVKSEFEIAQELATADEPLSVAELVERTGYTERTVDKRLGTLEERLGGSPLIRREDDDTVSLHPLLAQAVQNASDDN